MSKILFIQDGTEAEIALAGAMLVFFVFTVIIVFVAFFYQRRRQQHRQKMLDIQKQYSEELLKTRLEIQEETFKNISQEMHDNIGQSLIFAKLTISTLDIHNEETAKQKLFDTREQLAKTIQDIRDLAKTLDPNFLSQLGLPGSISQQLHFLQRTGEVATELIINGDEKKYPPQKELVVFRIVQELLNNIVKHANAQLVTITMQYNSSNLLITVQDNGQGFDTEKARNAHSGLGLANMHNRMSMVGGSFTINSTPGNGTNAVIELPA